MSKRGVVSIVLALVLVAGAYVVFTNSHIDIFPCEKTEKNFTTDKLETKSGTCSLLGIAQIERGMGIEGERAELLPVGWALAVVAVGIVPALLGFFIGRAVVKPKTPT